MNFVDTIGWTPANKAVAIDQCVKISIGRARWHDNGRVENLRAEHDKLVEIVALIAAQLPDDKQTALANAIGFVPEIL